MTVLKVLFWVCIVLVVYTYVGYAVVLWCLVRLKRLLGKRERTPALPLNEDRLPTVTLMICAYN